MTLKFKQKRFPGSIIPQHPASHAPPGSSGASATSHFPSAASGNALDRSGISPNRSGNASGVTGADPVGKACGPIGSSFAPTRTVGTTATTK